MSGKHARFNGICIMCGAAAEFRKNLMDIKQNMVIQGTYCQDHALEQCDNEKMVITRFITARDMKR